MTAGANELLIADDLEGAERFALRTLRDAPADAEALHVLGLVQARRGRLRAAIAYLEESLRLLPDAAVARNAIVLSGGAHQWEVANSLLRTFPECAGGEDPAVFEVAALAAQHDRHLGTTPAAAFLRATRLREAGDVIRACELFRQAISLGGHDRKMHAGFLYTLLHDPSATPHELLTEHRRWCAWHSPRQAAQPAWANSRHPGRRIKLGYLGGDFRCSPAIFLSLPVLRNHDRDRFQVFLYDGGERIDACTGEFAAAADVYRDCRALDGSGIADAIRADEIDILIEACGHFADTLYALASRPAPITLFFPKYPCASGHPEMDWYITDDVLSPPGTEGEYSEQLLYMPGGALAYSPPSECPAVASQPCDTNGVITFGVFQRSLKFHPEFWDTVGQLMQAVPDARILLHSGDDDEELPYCFAARLAARGVHPERLQFCGRLDTGSHLRLAGTVDIALDTFPYNGQTTTFECLWMGVPVVTLRGPAHVGRVASAILTRLGLADMAAATRQEFVTVAADLANDRARLRRLRSGLRARMAVRLANPAAFTRELEQCLDAAWNRWCALNPKEQTWTTDT